MFQLSKGNALITQIQHAFNNMVQIIKKKVYCFKIGFRNQREDHQKLFNFKQINRSHKQSFYLIKNNKTYFHLPSALNNQIVAKITVKDQDQETKQENYPSQNYQKKISLS